MGFLTGMPALKMSEKIFQLQANKGDNKRIIEKYIYCFGIEQTPVFYEKHNL